MVSHLVLQFLNTFILQRIYSHFKCQLGVKIICAFIFNLLNKINYKLTLKVILFIINFLPISLIITNHTKRVCKFVNKYLMILCSVLIIIFINYQLNKLNIFGEKLKHLQEKPQNLWSLNKILLVFERFWWHRDLHKFVEDSVASLDLSAYKLNHF